MPKPTHWKVSFENKPWLCLLISSHPTSLRIRSFWLYNLYVGFCGSWARLICLGVTMSSTGNLNSQHLNAESLNLMFGGVLNESGSSKVLKYRTEKKRLMTVLSLGSCVVSRKIPIHFTEASFSSTVFSCSVWCFVLETLQWGRLKNCGSMQSIHYPKLSACEVAGCVKLTREQKPGLCLGWIPIALLTLFLWSIESWMGHGNAAAVSREAVLDGPHCWGLSQALCLPMPTWLWEHAEQKQRCLRKCKGRK